MSNSLQPHGLYSPCNSPGQNTGVGSLSCLQGIFPIQGSNPGLPHCRWILYQLSHKGSPSKENKTIISKKYPCSHVTETLFTNALKTETSVAVSRLTDQKNVVYIINTMEYYSALPAPPQIKKEKKSKPRHLQIQE